MALPKPAESALQRPCLLEQLEVLAAAAVAEAHRRPVVELVRNLLELGIPGYTAVAAPVRTVAAEAAGCGLAWRVERVTAAAPMKRMTRRLS